MTFCILVRNRDGNLNVPYLYENGDKVVMNWNWLDNDWNNDNPALRFATLFISRPALAGLSFVSSTARSIRRASSRLHQVALKEQYIFSYHLNDI